MANANQSVEDFRGDHLSIKMFGAVADGSADASAAIQAAIDTAAAAGGASLWCGPGTFKAKGIVVKTGVTLDASGAKFIPADGSTDMFLVQPGAVLTGLRATASASYTGAFVKFEGDYTDGALARLTDFVITGHAGGGTAVSVVSSLQGVAWPRIDHGTITNCNYGIRLQSTGSPTTTWTNDIKASNVVISNCVRPIRLEAQSGDVIGNSFVDVSIQWGANSTQPAVVLDAATGTKCYGNNFIGLTIWDYPEGGSKSVVTAADATRNLFIGFGVNPVVDTDDAGSANLFLQMVSAEFTPQAFPYHAGVRFDLNNSTGIELNNRTNGKKWMLYLDGTSFELVEMGVGVPVTYGSGKMALSLSSGLEVDVADGQGVTLKSSYTGTPTWKIAPVGNGLQFVHVGANVPIELKDNAINLIAPSSVVISGIDNNEGITLKGSATGTPTWKFALNGNYLDLVHLGYNVPISFRSGGCVIDEYPILTAATASRPLKTDASKQLLSGLIDLGNSNDVACSSCGAGAVLGWDGDKVVPASVASPIGTQSVVTGSRALGTVYQNTTGKPLFVSVIVVVPAGNSVVGYTDSTSTPTTGVAQYGNSTGSSASFSTGFWVLPGNYYKVAGGASTLSTWTEWY